MTSPLSRSALEIGRPGNEIKDEEFGIESLGDGSALVGRVNETKINLLHKFGSSRRRGWRRRRRRRWRRWSYYTW